ncbi:MAG: hypothetical protein ACOC3W_07995, partial [Thermodesulfobacteriota bacterium]
EGIRLYSDLLNMLTDQQKAKVEEIIGTPFPAPWEKMFPMNGDSDDMSRGDDMSMDMEGHEGHHMGENGSEMETEPQGEMEMKEDTGSAT